MKNIKRLLLDADDTLWENNIYFLRATEQFFELMQESGIREQEIRRAFFELEHRVVQENGYGSEFFILILEKLIARYKKGLTKKHLQRYRGIIEDFKQHRHDPPPLFPGVMKTLQSLTKRIPLYVVTKGQQEEQEDKIVRSGVAAIVKDYFILPEKNEAIYKDLLDRNKWEYEMTCMVGNSPKSDINPALKLGMKAVYIPYKSTWHMENESVLERHENFLKINNFSDLLQLF